MSNGFSQDWPSGSFTFCFFVLFFIFKFGDGPGVSSPKKKIDFFIGCEFNFSIFNFTEGEPGNVPKRMRSVRTQIAGSVPSQRSLREQESLHGNVAPNLCQIFIVIFFLDCKSRGSRLNPPVHFCSLIIDSLPGVLHLLLFRDVTRQIYDISMRQSDDRIFGGIIFLGFSRRSSTVSSPWAAWYAFDNFFNLKNKFEFSTLSDLKM